MKRILMCLVCISIVANFPPDVFAGKEKDSPPQMTKSSTPRIIEVEEDVWLEKNNELAILRDELLSVSAELRVAEAEIERLQLELINAKKGIEGAKMRTHTVEEGENLWKIAQKYYKDPFKWLWLFKANIEQLEDPDELYPNQVIDIPRY